MAVAALTALVAFNVKGRLSQFKKVRAVLILVGFLYTIYLVYYQFFGIGELCALCLTSAGITTALFVAQGVDYSKTTPAKMHTSRLVASRPNNELAYMGILAVLLVVLVGADFAYFNGLETSEPSVAASEASQILADSQADGPVVAFDTCFYDSKKGQVDDFSSLINVFDPTKGNPDASVTVIEYFDPNCPHCKTLHPIVEQVATTHADKARFVFKPFVLWPHSLAQSEALYAAAQDGKFFEMLDLQYAMQQPQTGLSTEQLRAMARQIGMSPDVLMQRVESGIYRNILSEQRDLAAEAGVTGTPAVLINGRFVDGRSRTAECLAELIDDAAQS
jgi:protein-disulfide isomerase